MKKTMFSCLSVWIFLSIGTIAGAVIDISGEWKMNLTTPKGKWIRKITFTQDEEKLKVVMEGHRESIEGEGRIDGTTVEWTIIRTTPRGEIPVTYEGTIEGDTMSGQARMGSRSPFEWTAERIREENSFL